MQPSGKSDLAVFEPEAAALEVGEQGLDAPAQAIIEGRVDRGRLRQGDDPGFGMAGLVHPGDVGAHALPGQLDVPQPVLAAAETVRQRGLAAVLEHEQVLFEPQPPIPALTTAPGDQFGAARRPIPHQHRLPSGCRAGAGGVILTPVRDLALLLGNVVTAVLVQLEGQGGHPGIREGAIRPQRQRPDPCNSAEQA